MGSNPDWKKMESLTGMQKYANPRNDRFATSPKTRFFM